MIGKIQDLSLVLCLLLRRVVSDFMAEEKSLVDGVISRRATLPCSFIIPENWRDHDIHVSWYKNFTDKLLDCSLKDGMAPVCQKYPEFPRVQLSQSFLGNVALDIHSLQDSDQGWYQCWIIFNEAYQRRDSLLRVHSDTGMKSEAEPYKEFVGWQVMVVMSSWNALLLSGWPFAFLLAGILMFYRCRSTKKRKSFNI